ncbi:conserved hypothetical protein [Segniliparus rotundus DSM 44985]|uniref:DUF4190 domain-containing protein n=1 Tax=Segniliparus rotundus (strain ATCC BAA-972 / CDC 1076 / CIP 108378 / DSM 44985 / JCM 13578) TaxID=640132 RepID=D6Z8N6_SEGRD|nr:DUF4190 domain-containing protein [Segniliparus rotundus]ADG98316.1 conserved hypothetical protein [Segniliparus rotundus DSM 44985]
MTYPPGQNPYGQPPHGGQSPYGGQTPYGDQPAYGGQPVYGAQPPYGGQPPNPYGQQPYGGAGGYSAPQQGAGTDTFGVIGLILGIAGILLDCCCVFTAVFGVLLSLIALVLGILGIQKAKREQRGPGLSIGAAVLGGIGLIIAMIALIAFLAFHFAGAQNGFGSAFSLEDFHVRA